MARSLSWAVSANLATVIAGATLLVDLTGQFRAEMGLLNLPQWTVTRIIGEIAVRPIAPSSLGIDDAAAAIGIWNDQAFGAGSGSLPNPQVNSGDFMWWFGGGIPLEGFEGPSTFFGAHTRIIPIETRAQRIIRGNDRSLILIYVNAGTIDQTVYVATRVLLRHA